MACGWIQQIQDARKAITDHFRPIKDGLNATRTTVLKMEKASLARLEPYESQLSAEIARWERDEAPDDLILPEGHSRRPTLRVVVERFEQLIAAVHRGDIDQDSLLPNLPALTKRARQMGGLYRVPGTRVEHGVTVITTTCD